MANSAEPEKFRSQLIWIYTVCKGKIYPGSAGQGLTIKFYSFRVVTRVDARIDHTCHKLWTKICEIRQNFKEDLTKFCETFLNITLELPKYSLRKKLVKTTTMCDLCLFLHKICFNMVWKFCEIWKFYGICLSDGTNSMRFISQCEIWHVWLMLGWMWVHGQTNESKITCISCQC